MTPLCVQQAWSTVLFFETKSILRGYLLLTALKTCTYICLCGLLDSVLLKKSIFSFTGFMIIAGQRLLSLQLSNYGPSAQCLWQKFEPC